jgi:2-haloacid dehalogenase
MAAVRPKQQIKALVFDAYGTLFDVHSVISVCNQLFPEQGAALSQTWRAKQLEYTWLRSLMGYYEDFWQVTESALAYACTSLNLLDEPATRAQLMEAYLHLEPYPEVRQALRALSDYSLAILSNGSPRMLQAAVESAGLEGIFSHVISVDEVKIFKPSPRVYQLALRKLGLDASAIGFVSSNSWDVIGAKAFGFWTYWANRSNTPGDELGFTPDLTISRLTDLASIIKS